MDVAEISGRLDVAEAAGMRGRIVHIPSRVQDRLVGKGILKRGKPDWTPLGLAVRAHLLNQDTDHD